MNKGSCILVKNPVIQKLELKISLPAADIVDMNDGKSLLKPEHCVLGPKAAVFDCATCALDLKTCVSDPGVCVLDTETSVPVPETCAPVLKTCVQEPETCVPVLETCVLESETCVPDPETCVPVPETCVPVLKTCVLESETCVPVLETCVLESETCVPDPETCAPVLETCVLEPETCVPVLKTCVLESETCVPVLETCVLNPETYALIPDSKAVLAYSENQPEVPLKDPKVGELRLVFSVEDLDMPGVNSNMIPKDSSTPAENDEKQELESNPVSLPTIKPSLTQNVNADPLYYIDPLGINDHDLLDFEPEESEEEDDETSPNISRTKDFEQAILSPSNVLTSSPSSMSIGMDEAPVPSPAFSDHFSSPSPRCSTPTSSPSNPWAWKQSSGDTSSPDSSINCYSAAEG